MPGQTPGLLHHGGITSSGLSRHDCDGDRDAGTLSRPAGKTGAQCSPAIDQIWKVDRVKSVVILDGRQKSYR